MNEVNDDDDNGSHEDQRPYGHSEQSILDKIRKMRLKGRINTFAENLRETNTLNERAAFIQDKPVYPDSNLIDFLKFSRGKKSKKK